jgi:SAM-dependent MidA family methyltransferase
VAVDIADPVIETRYKDGIMHHTRSLALPQPDPDSAAHSQAVAAHIRERIAAAGGSISFAEYMHECLYAPGLGYYSAGAIKFGSGGDFTTAPEVSSLFGALLAGQLREVLAQLASPAILEIGAGSGRLAADILESLLAADSLPPGGYHILEVSPDLQQRQRALLTERVPDIVGHVHWIDCLPGDFEGAVIANEVLDALPVERFVCRGGRFRQVRVAAERDDFRLVDREAPPHLAAEIEAIEQGLGRSFTEDYASEVCLAVRPWVTDVCRGLAEGCVFLFDYGVTRREYYAPERSGGWLRCHFRHHAHDDPLVLPGIQDLTSWVDFTRVAEAAVDSGMAVAGFTNQAQFLIGAGLEQFLANLGEMPIDAQLRMSGEVKLLTLPTEMGENFKCLGLSRGAIEPPPASTLG